MVGKNNQYLKNTKEGTKVETYSIKKFKVGTASVVIGASIFLGAGAVAQASEEVSNNTTADNTTNAGVKEEAPKAVEKAAKVENTKESDLRNENNPTYVKLQELLGDVSGDGTNKIYVPYVGVIRDGKVVDFMLSFDYDAHTVQITEEQIEEYKKLLNELLDK